MDFSEDFSDIQSIFNYANASIKPLHKIQFRGGEWFLFICYNYNGNPDLYKWLTMCNGN